MDIANDATRYGVENQSVAYPLLAKVGWRDDEDAALALCPPLREHQPRLDGLAKPDLVGQQHTTRERRLEGEQRRVDLVRVQVDLGIDQGAG